jgi:hypothetical protein
MKKIEVLIIDENEYRTSKVFKEQWTSDHVILRKGCGECVVIKDRWGGACVGDKNMVSIGMPLSWIEEND